MKHKNIICLFLFTFLSIFLFTFLSIFLFIHFASLYKTNIEGFNSYTSCIEQGYPMDFCIKTPIQSKIDNGYCSCANGYFGSWHMDDGKCYCYLFDGLLPYKTSRPFQTTPF